MAERSPYPLQPFAVSRRVVPQSGRLHSHRLHIGGFTGMKGGRHDQSLAERSLEMSGHERMQRTYIAQLQECAVLQVVRCGPRRPSQLQPERDPAAEIEPVAGLQIDRVRPLEILYITCVYACEQFMFGIVEDLARVEA